MYIQIFKRLKIYISILIVLTIGIFAYGDIVLANKPAKIDINTARKEAIQKRIYVPFRKIGHHTDSPSTYNFLNLYRIICNATAEFASYNLVTIRVFKHNPDMANGLELLASWGPQQLTYGNNNAVNIGIPFQDDVLVEVSYLSGDGTEYSIGEEWLNGANYQNLNFINQGNNSNYSVSYSISLVNSFTNPSNNSSQ